MVMTHCNTLIEMVFEFMGFKIIWVLNCAIESAYFCFKKKSSFLYIVNMYLSTLPQNNM